MHSRQILLEAIGKPTDLTLVNCASGISASVAAEGARALLDGLSYRELDLEHLSKARGDTALLLGADFSWAHRDVAPRALGVAELRFARVIVLPCSFDTDDATVADALQRSRAVVFASEPESLERISELCDAKLAHDCAFFYDFEPYARPGTGSLNAFRSDLGADTPAKLPEDNDDISLTAASLPDWLEAIAAHDLVRTDRPEVMIAAAQMGKRVEFTTGLDDQLEAIARWSLGDLSVVAIEAAEGADTSPAQLDPISERTLAELRSHARPTVGDGAQSSESRVTAVILTRGRPRFLRRALDSLDDCGAPVGVIVVDNASPKALIPALEAVCASRPGTVLHRSERNLGTAGGRNHGVSVADSELVLFLDDDAELVPGALAHLLAELDRNPGAGAVTATVFRPDGTIIHSGGALEVNDEIARFELLGDGQLPSAEMPPRSSRSGWMPQTAALVRRDLLREIPFDEQMNAYFEDNSWSLTVSQARPDAFLRSREALVLHHLAPKHSAGADFTARCEIVRLLQNYAHFFDRHGVLLGPWLFDHVSQLRAQDGSCDLPSARLLMELVSAKGPDWILMEWMNGDLEGLLSAGERLVKQQESESCAEQWRVQAELLATETQRFRSRAVHDAQTISSLDAQLNATSSRIRAIEGSVTWQLFQRTRGKIFGLLGGEDSRGVAAVQSTLRYVGRHLQSHRRSATVPAAGTRLTRAARRSHGPINLPTSDQPLVSIVVPLYAHAELTRAALDSIREHTQLIEYEVILVDDAADAGTKTLLTQVSGARIIVNETNIGYLRSVRRGAEAARGQWLVLCNNDIEVQPGWLAALLDCGDSAADIAIVAPKYIFPDGTLAEAGGVVWRDGSALNYGRGQPPESCYFEFRREIDYGSAAALLVRRDLWEDVGGFDERFLPMYYEDTDLCFEARARGLRVMYEPRARVIHHEGATAGVDQNSGHKRFQQSNQPKFVEKWGERLEAEHMPKADPWQGATMRYRQRVLVVDHRMPMWDRESGALRMRGILQSLLELGCHVSFLPDNLLAMQPYTRELQRMGVEVLHEIEVPSDLIRIAPGLSMVFLSRPQVAAHWLDFAREQAPQALVVYDTVDLHWLREARRAMVALGPDARELVMTSKARAMRELELGLIGASDVNRRRHRQRARAGRAGRSGRDRSRSPERQPGA